MSSQFRPTSPADAPAISAFMQMVFGMAPDHPGLDPRQMEWKYWRAHPQWEGPRGYLVERDGQIAAHGSVVPLACAWGSRRLRMVDLIDWAAHPAHPGAGITLLRRVSQLVDGVFIAGGTEKARQVFKSLGFHMHPNALRLALPIHPLARWLDTSEPVWKRTARLARNTAWRLRAFSVLPGNWTARRLGAAEIPSAQFPVPHPRAEPAVFERSAETSAFLLECPITPAEFYVVEKDGQPRGYFVLALAVAQGRIVEAWMEPGSTGDWRALYSLAIRQAAKHPELREVVTVVTNDAAAREGLMYAGFRPRGELPLCSMFRERDRPGEIRYQMVDNDNAWQHDGSSYYWS
jgi:hypothetical protein